MNRPPPPTTLPPKGKHPMRVMGEFCALLWGPSKHSRPQPQPAQHSVPQAQPQPPQPPPLTSPLAARTQVHEIALPPEQALAQGLPPGVVLRRTTIDEICVLPSPHQHSHPS
jgi:hypothetical protein